MLPVTCPSIFSLVCSYIVPERLRTSTVFFLIDTLELDEATIPAKEIVNKMNAITLKMISPVMVASTDLKKLFIDFFVLCSIK